METYYQVTYTTEKGLSVSYKRDTVQRGWFLYKDLIEDDIKDIKLEEVSDSGITLLRGNGIYKPIEIKEESKQEEPKQEKPRDWFEMVWGISREEYNNCIRRWNGLTGENNELL